MEPLRRRFPKLPPECKTPPKQLKFKGKQDDFSPTPNFNGKN